MEAAIAFGVCDKAVAFLVKLAAVGQIFIGTLGKIIFIHKVIAGIIRRVDVDHLDLAQVGLLKQLQHLQVIALNIEVFGVKAAGSTVLAHTFLTARAQGLGNRRIGQKDRLLLIRPGELVTLVLALNHCGADLLHQHILINGADHLTVFVDGLGHCIGKQCRQLVEVFIRLIRRVHLQFVHLFYLLNFFDESIQQIL